MTLRRYRPLGLLLLCSFICTLCSKPAAAIPVFARIYDKPCGACHTVFPQLNPDGENFRVHGLHGLTPAVKPIELGSRLDVPGTLPLALYLSAGGDLSRVDPPDAPSTTDKHVNFEFLSLLFGGELGSHLAFLGDYAPIVTNSQTGQTEVNTHLGLGFLQAHAEPSGWLINVKGGLFELPLGASPRVHRLSVRPYLVYGLTASELLARPPPEMHDEEANEYGVSSSNTPVLADTQIGIEVSGLEPVTGYSWAVGGTNGSNNGFKGDASKDVYLRLAQSFGLHRAGFFLYYSPNLGGPGPDNRSLRLGPDVSFYWRRLRLWTQFLAQYASSPTGHSEGLWYYGGFVEGDYRLTPALLALLRIDYARAPTFDDTMEGGETHVRPRVWELTSGVQWLLLENLKLLAEVTYGEDHDGISDRTAQAVSATARVVTAFWPLEPLGHSPVVTPPE